MILATPLTATAVHMLGFMQAYRFAPITMMLVHGFMLIVLIEMCRASVYQWHTRQKDTIRSGVLSIFSSCFWMAQLHRFLEFRLRTYGDVIFRGTWDRYVDRTDERFERGFRALSYGFSTPA